MLNVAVKHVFVYVCNWPYKLQVYTCLPAVQKLIEIRPQWIEKDDKILKRAIVKTVLLTYGHKVAISTSSAVVIYNAIVICLQDGKLLEYLRTFMPHNDV